MVNKAIFDTSVLIDHLRTNKHLQKFQSLKAIIRTSSVVFSELYRGATKDEEVDFVNMLARTHPVLTPTERNWIESGKILLNINKDKGFTSAKLRDLHFDLLIALTARTHGATVITANKKDFELIFSYRIFKLEIW